MPTYGTRVVRSAPNGAGYDEYGNYLTPDEVNERGGFAGGNGDSLPGYGPGDIGAGAGGDGSDTMQAIAGVTNRSSGVDAGAGGPLGGGSVASGGGAAINDGRGTFNMQSIQRLLGRRNPPNLARAVGPQPY